MGYGTDPNQRAKNEVVCIVVGAIVITIILCAVVWGISNSSTDYLCKELDHEHSGEYQSYDGSNNHKDATDKDYGKVGNMFRRHHSAEYSDGKSKPAGNKRPNPRHISNKVCFKETREPIPNRRGLSAMTWLWGQFVDHTVTLSPPDHSEMMRWDITGDPTYDPEYKGLNFSVPRTIYQLDKYGARQQRNMFSSYMDAAVVYGVSEARLSRMRLGKYGRMKLDSNGLLPINVWQLPNDLDKSDRFFVAGDVRVNEHSGLTALHMLWVHEHNYWADHYYRMYPTWSDERIFQAARRIVIAEHQAVTYNEFIPALLGTKLRNNCFNQRTDPSIFNEFSTAAYRVGHTLVNEHIEARDERTGEIKKRFNLEDTFFTPEHFKNGSINMGEMLLGFSKMVAEEIDVKIVDSMRNARVGSHPFDLAAFNIARGRDHGLPDYVTLRWKVGGEPVSSWNDISSDADTVKRLKDAYGEYGWRDLDPWVGMVAEDHYPGSSVGYTMHHIILDQFQRIRDGDSYMYLWDSNMLYERERIHATKLKDIILRHTKINPSYLNDNVFFG